MVSTTAIPEPLTITDAQLAETVNSLFGPVEAIPVQRFEGFVKGHGLVSASMDSLIENVDYHRAVLRVTTEKGTSFTVNFAFTPDSAERKRLGDYHFKGQYGFSWPNVSGYFHSPSLTARGTKSPKIFQVGSQGRASANHFAGRWHQVFRDTSRSSKGGYYAPLASDSDRAVVSAEFDALMSMLDNFELPRTRTGVDSHQARRLFSNLVSTEKSYYQAQQAWIDFCTAQMTP